MRTKIYTTLIIAIVLLSNISLSAKTITSSYNDLCTLTYNKTWTGSEMNAFVDNTAGGGLASGQFSIAIANGTLSFQSSFFVVQNMKLGYILPVEAGFPITDITIGDYNGFTFSIKNNYLHIAYGNNTTSIYREEPLYLNTTLNTTICNNINVDSCILSYEKTWTNSDLLVLINQSLGGHAAGRLKLTISNGHIMLDSDFFLVQNAKLGSVIALNLPVMVPNTIIGKLNGITFSIQNNYLHIAYGTNTSQIYFEEPLYFTGTFDIVFCNNSNTYLSAGENYIHKTNYKKPFTEEQIKNHIPLWNEKIENIQYINGLGKLKQTNSIRQGNQNQDIVKHIEYDQYGRQRKEYLPFSLPSNVYGSYNSNSENDAKTYHYNKYKSQENWSSVATSNPYSEKEWELSPLNRQTKQAAPGNNWKLSSTNEHVIIYDYKTNITNEVVDFYVAFSNNNRKEPIFQKRGYYAPNQLYKIITKNENWKSTQTNPTDNTSVEFRDKQDRLILKRDHDKGRWHDTYYVYDDFGNLTYVLPPQLNTYPNEQQIWKDESFAGESISTFYVPIVNFDYYNEYYVSINNNFLSVYFDDFGQGPQGVALNTTTPVFDLGFTLNTNLPDMVLGPVTIKKQNGTVSDTHYTARLQGGKIYLSGDGTPAYAVTLDVGLSLNDYTGNLGIVIDNNTLNDYAYQYKYDERNRLIEKKLPGKDWEYIVYDKLDRVMLTQDANLKSNNKWLFTKYDPFDRAVYTGIWTNPTSGQTREQVQTTVNNQTNVVWSENKLASQQIVGTPATTIYYTNNAFPKTNFEILNVNYFDNYVFDFGSTPFISGLASNVKSLATGSKTKILDYNTWIKTTTYYDEKARVIYTASENENLATKEYVRYTLDFIGKVTKTETTHQKGNNTPITIVDNFTYDHAGRLLTQKQKINALPEQLIAKNTYDELGLLIRKDVGNTEVNPLQKVDYDYNIRGWLKSINNTSRLQNNLFAFDIKYDDVEKPLGYSNVEPLYNGNISATNWKTDNGTTAHRGYYYAYDNLNRFKTGNYFENDQITSKYNESINAYDRNGNILTLYRQGQDSTNPLNIGYLDNLTYTYKGNRLMAVKDNYGTTGNAAEGFKDGNTVGDDYTYDANGNMLVDKNKGITTNIIYNHLNLPTEIEFSNGGKIGYVYDAKGTKISKTVIQPGLNNGPTTEYSGSFIYQKQSSGSASVLQFFSHPEGYVANNNGTYSYVFQYKDHLGNIRLSYADTNGDGVVTGGSTEIFYDGFESANGWGNLNAEYGSPITGYDTNKKHSGNYSGKIEKFTAGEQVTQRNSWIPISNSQPTEYIFSAWVYSDGPSADIFLFMNKAGETAYYTDMDYIRTATTGRWIYVEKKVTVLQNIVNLNIRIDNNGGVPGAGTVWFDDISIRRVNPAGSVEIVEENNYYPFGMRHKGYNDVLNLNKANAIAQNYKYNGKELQDELGLNMYDYGARNYDTAIGRWMNIDPLAENSRRWTPYNYAYNNPMYFIDPDGREALSPIFDNKTGAYLGNDSYGFMRGDILFMDRDRYAELSNQSKDGIINHNIAVKNSRSIADLPDTRGSLVLFHNAVDFIAKTTYLAYYGENPTKGLLNGSISVSSDKLRFGTNNAPNIGTDYGQNVNWVDEDAIIFNFDQRKDLNTAGNIGSLFEHEYHFHGKMNLRQKMGKTDVHQKIYPLQANTPLFKRYATGEYRKQIEESARIYQTR